MSQLKFMCPRWGFETIPWDEFLGAVKDAGYSGIEWFPFGEACDYDKVLDLLLQYNLDFCVVMAVIEPYIGYENYIAKLKADLHQLMEVIQHKKVPLFITAQTGREFYTYDEILVCLQVCSEMQETYGIPIYQETHRNKWAYAAHVVAPVLKENKEVFLTLDVSHWFCVSESYLEDQQLAVNEAILQTRHIHARVGDTQGPQVWDPSNMEYAKALEEHLKIWDRYVEQMKQKKKEYFTITPEFGPPPYLVKGDRNISLTQEQWRLNLWMKDFLKNRYT
ncbi:sugar phosphate isomerase/epimerase [Pedobacter sp. CG_S7]|uniref:sugar phosphate isomerase/epimerase family protein n=1 Tax=Pedobacter sp. CG_S7 TaxID=3143930 RepID=UPI0033994DE8